MKSGSEMRVHHSPEMHRNLHADLTGTLERISNNMSFGNEMAPAVDGVCVLLVMRAAVERRRRFGEGRTGDPGGVMVVAAKLGRKPTRFGSSRARKKLEPDLASLSLVVEADEST
jgi:hypothetical protein